MATMWSLTVLRRANVKAVAKLSTTILSILVVAILLGLPAVALVLGNVTATAPYGHDGAYGSLASFLEAHVDPIKALGSYDRTEAVLPDFPGAEDWRILENEIELSRITESVNFAKPDMSETDIQNIVEFLSALTDEAALSGRLGIPVTVPSELPFDH